MYGQSRNRSGRISTLAYMQQNDVKVTTEDSSPLIKAQEFQDREVFKGTLRDLKSNSKPLICTITDLSEEYLPFAKEIVQIIEAYLDEVPINVKLYVLYLIDSIIKYQPQTYLPLFSKNIITNFVKVFTMGSEKMRSSLFKLRQTWSEVFSSNTLLELDIKIQKLDPAWPLEKLHQKERDVQIFIKKSEESLSSFSTTSADENSKKSSERAHHDTISTKNKNNRSNTKRRLSEPTVINAKVPKIDTSSLFGNKDIDLRTSPTIIPSDQLANDHKNKSGHNQSVSCQQTSINNIRSAHQSTPCMSIVDHQSMPSMNVSTHQSLDVLNTSVSEPKSPQSQLKTRCKQESQGNGMDQFGSGINTQIVHSVNSRIELPPPNEDLLKTIKKDSMSSIDMDGKPRIIRHYGETAVVFLANDDPRIITFHDGVRLFKMEELKVPLKFNCDYLPLIYNGVFHKIKLGTPTRELYINDKYYKSHFNDQKMQVTIGDKKVYASLEGPVPSVKIGQKTDLVVASINLIIDQTQVHTIFIDAKPQIVRLGAVECILEFADALKTVLLNGKPFPVDFGGFEKAVIVNGKRHYLRFSKLPKHVIPGYIKINGMKGEQPIPVQPNPLHKEGNLSGNPFRVASKDISLNNAVKIDQPVDVLAFFQKLVDSGIVPPSSNNTFSTQQETSSSDSTTPELPSFNDKFIKNKKNAPATVKELYDGKPCSICGERVRLNETASISDHNNVHFHENCREQLGKSSSHSRYFYNTVEEWALNDNEKMRAITGSNFSENKNDSALEKIESNNDTEQLSVTCSITTDTNGDLLSKAEEAVELEKSEDFFINENVTLQSPINQLIETEKDSDSDAALNTVELHVLESNVPIMNDSSNSGTEDSDHVEVIESAPKVIEVEEIDDSSDDEDSPLCNKTKKILETRRQEIKLSRSVQKIVMETPKDVPLIFHNVKIKEEPIDNSEMEVEDVPRSIPDSTKVTIQSTIDGNVEFDKAIQIVPKLNPIKLNIISTHKKAASVKITKTAEEVKEPIVEQKLHQLIPTAIKPNLEGKKFSKMPKVVKGGEVSSMCCLS